MTPRWPTLVVLMCSASAVSAAGWVPAATSSEAAPLRADQAFQLLPAERHGHAIKLEWSIAPGYFLYRDRIHVDLSGPGGTIPAVLKMPAAQAYDEPGEGPVQVYRDDLRVSLQASADVAPHALQVRYQGCSDSGICYPPQTRTVPIKDSE